jgi:protein-L-isoaspartate(D-aspartate) O-methyltransferase
MKKDAFVEQRESMVLYQIERRGIVDPRILEAMRSVPRHLFVPEEYIQDSYNDHPLPIGSGQTISQPYIVAFMTNILDLHSDENVLEIGTGSGYQAAVLAQLVKTVHSVERIPELAQQASRTLLMLGITNVQVHQGDGTLGWQADAPYQAILVTAAAPAAPQALLDQLDLNGRMVIPVGTRFYQTLELWKKSKKGCKVQEVLPVVFVPLKGEQGWKENEW